MNIKPGTVVKRYNSDDLSVVLSVVEGPNPRLTLEGVKYETYIVVGLVNGQQIRTITLFSDVDELF